MSEKTKKPLAKCSSDAFRVTLYGILNSDGDFWTPLTFESVGAARQHIRDFWGRRQPDMAERCLRDFRIVPVHVDLTEIRP